MSAKFASRKSLSILKAVMVTFAVLLLLDTPSAYAGDAPATQYVDRRWENGQVVSETKTQNDVAWMTDGHLNWHNNWWYTRDLDELVISDRVSVDPGATANLILMDGKTIEFENGIRVPKGSTLNIYGQAQGTGKLIVLASEADTAAIGGNAGESCGTINIFGGTIQVRGGSEYSNGGAGIGGGGSASNESSINIYGGTIISTGGANAAGIGGGARGGHGGAINIYGGVVTAYGDSGAAGIGGGEGGSGSGTYIYGGIVSAKGGSLYSDGGAGIGSGNKNGNNSIAAGDVVIYGGTVFAEGGADAAGIGGGNEVSGGRVIINEVYSNIKVKAWGGTLGAGIGGGQYGNGGNIEIRIGDDPDKSKVEAAGGEDGAGIGGGSCGSGGNIEIYSGYVLADGGDYGAGIGSGDADGDGIDGGNIKIYGGSIHVMGGTDAAGIGGGEGAGAGTIDIRNATVRASGGSRTSEGGAAIGSGDKDGRTFNNGTITISDSDIIANGGAEAAGIGGGHNCNGGTITIINSTVIAYNGDGSDGGAGIGGGGGEDERTPKADGTAGAGTIKIIDCPMVKASGGNGAAGIGGGYYADDNNDGNVTIENSNVEAKGGKYAAGIGTGKVGVSLFGESSISEYKVNVSINGGTIKATGGDEGGAGIGGGSYGYSGAIRIYGGIVEATGGGNGGAGIGSGDDVDRPGTTVDIVIEGGTITARAGKMPSKEEGNYNNLNHPGAAIGTGGCGTSSGSRDMSYFRGSIYLNGGDITAYGAECESGYGSADNKCTAIGATVEKSLVGGKVYFNGAHVEMYPGHGSENTSSQAVKASGIELKENNTLHQQVDYKLDGSDSLEVALKDNRVSTLSSTGKHYVEVKPCEHSNVNWTITDTTHSVVCVYCGYSVSDEAHTWSEPTYTWTDFTACRAERHCTVCDKTEGEDGVVTTRVHKEAICDEPGILRHIASFTLSPFTEQIKEEEVSAPGHDWDGWTQTKAPTCSAVGQEQRICKTNSAHKETRELAINPNAHSWGEPTYEWATDNSTVTAKRACANDSRHVETETVETTSQVTKPATCEEKGETTYTSKAFENEAFAEQTKTVANIDALNHDWNEPTYEWATDNSTVTATRVCKNDSSHVETETVETTSQVTKPATCEEKGETTYTSKAFESEAFEVQEKTVANIDALNHAWGEPTYEWATDNSSVTATRTCKHDSRHVETETVETTSQVTKPATCEEKGETTYTSKAFENEAFEVQEKTVANIDALDHDWGEPSYEWATDNSTVTATRVCKNDSSHVETETVGATSEISKQPTCTEKGETTYTSVAFNNKAFIVQTKTVVNIEALDHDWGEWTQTQAPTCSAVGKEERVCNRNADHKETRDVAIDPKAHKWGEWTESIPATETTEGEETRVCEHNAEHKETRPIAKSDHVHRLSHVDVKPVTCTEAGNIEYWVCTEGENPCGRYFADAEGTEELNAEELVIAALNHAWGEITYKWADDNSEVTATRVCEHDATHVETETADVTSETIKQPTCSAAGETTYTAIFENPAFAEQSKTEEDVAIDPDAHVWGAVAYEWADDNSKVTATRTCAHDATHTETETVETKSSVTKEPTETEEGERTYTATFTNPAFAKQTKMESIPKKDHVHDWNEPVYVWSADNSSVTATRTCRKDESHVETETVKTTAAVTREATETEEGGRIYAAAFTNPAFAEQTKTESIPKKEPVGPGPVDPDPAKPDPTDPEPQPQPVPDPADPQPAPSGSVSYRNTEGDGTQWTKGSAATADFTFKRSKNDSETFSHFIGIQVDGKDVAASSYTAEAGSVIVKLKPAYLETLSVGEHTITALFDDGNKASAKFTVVARKASGNSNATNSTTKNANTVSSTGAPKTGDTSNMLLWFTILCASILVLFNVIIIRRRNGFGRRG